MSCGTAWWATSKKQGCCYFSVSWLSWDNQESLCRPWLYLPVFWWERGRVILHDNQGGGELLMTPLENSFVSFYVSLDKHLNVQTAGLLASPKQRSTWYYPGSVSAVSTQRLQYLSDSVSLNFMDFTVRMWTFHLLIVDRTAIHNTHANSLCGWQPTLLSLHFCFRATFPKTIGEVERHQPL